MLEERGWIGRMNDQIEKSETYQHLLSTSHEMYARERWELLDEETKREVEGGSVGWPVERLRDSGVSGMTSRRGFMKFSFKNLSSNSHQSVDILPHIIPFG